MKVLFVGTTDFPAGGAAGRCMHAFSIGLLRLGHQVTVLMSGRKRSGPLEEEIDGIKVYWSTPAISNLRGRRLLRGGEFAKSRIIMANRLFGLLAQTKHDWILNYGCGSEVVLPALIASKRYGVPMASFWGDIVHRDMNVGTAEFLIAKSGQYLAVRRSTAVINLGSGLLKVAFHAMAPTQKVISIFPPVDTKVFSTAGSESFRKQRALGGVKLVTYAGGFKWFEGVGDLVTAMEPLLAADTTLHLALAGGSNLADLRAIEKLVSAAPSRRQISLLGFLELAEIAKLLATSNVLVIPKKDHPINHYAMPIKLGEYLASGNPVVCAAVGGCKDYLVHEQTALLYNPGDTIALRKSISRLLVDQELGRRVGNAGQKAAIASFDVLVAGKLLADALQD